MSLFSHDFLADRKKGRDDYLRLCRSLSQDSELVWYVIQKSDKYVCISENDLKRYEMMGYKVDACFYHTRRYKNCYKIGGGYQFV